MITIDADGNVATLPQSSAGVKTVTINAAGMTLVGGEYVPTGSRAVQYLTLTFLSSCSVTHGCDEFGLTRAGLVAGQRIPLFRQMSLATLRMFIASGADINEAVSGQNQILLFILIREHGIDSAHVRTMLDAGADVNAGANTRSGMVMAAAINHGDVELLRDILSLEGINADVASGVGSLGVLDLAAQGNRTEIAQLLREAGATCRLFNLPLCHG